MSYKQPRTHKTAQGLTLIEMLIALVILALISVGVFRLLQTVSQMQTVVRQHAQQLHRLERVWWIIGQDVQQGIVRSVRANNPAHQVPNAISLQQWYPVFWGNQHGNLMVLTRVGWSNPLHAPRSDVQQVMYRFEKGHLLRLYWSHLDPDAKTKPHRQILLKQLVGVQLRFLNASHHWQKHWHAEITATNDARVTQYPEPSATLSKAGITLLPLAVEVRIDDPLLGSVRRIFRLPAGAWPDQEIQSWRDSTQ